MFVVRGDRQPGEYLLEPIEDDWPYLWIEATYPKVRRGGRIVPVAVIITVGVSTDGGVRFWAWRSAHRRPSRSG